MRSRSPSPFDAAVASPRGVMRLAGALTLGLTLGPTLGLTALLAGCSRGEERTPQPVARVGDRVLDASVVQQIARDRGIGEDEARPHAIELLRAYAAAHEANEARPGEPQPLVTPEREAHLLRAARARVVLDDVFEPRHRAEDIPVDEPLLQRALASGRYVHPTLHEVCQAVVVPKDATDIDQAEAITSDPAWRERAAALIDAVEARVTRYVPVDDRLACDQLSRIVSMSKPREEGDLVLRYEAARFDLEACAVKADDGTCSEPRFDPAWTSAIGKVAAPGYSGIITSRWGLHFARVGLIAPGREADDPRAMQEARAGVHDAWRAREFQTWLDRLSADRAVRIASEAEAP